MTRTLAVVTGAGSGIGRAVALGFAARGEQVVAADIDVDAAAQTAATPGGWAVPARRSTPGPTAG